MIPNQGGAKRRDRTPQYHRSSRVRRHEQLSPVTEIKRATHPTIYQRANKKTADNLACQRLAVEAKLLNLEEKGGEKDDRAFEEICG
jgi:hypothetical protein